MLRAGLREPDLQPTIRSQRGEILGRVDFYWDHAGVVGEADGRVKYDDRDVLMAEKARQEQLEDAGLIVVRWTWADVRERPAALKLRIEQAFRRGRAREASGQSRNWLVERLPA